MTVQRALIVAWILCLVPATAQALSSSNYTIPQYDLSNGGQTLSSANYALEGSVSTIQGVLSSSSYGVDTGFPSTTGGTLTLSLDSASVTLGPVNPSGSTTATTVVTITTDAPGYNLALHKKRALTHTDGSTTVADYSGSIATPTTWSGTGFGFTVSSGTSLEAKWSSGTKFAALPTGTATTIHAVAAPVTSGNATTITYRLDASATQTAGQYSSLVGYSAKVLP